MSKYSHLSYLENPGKIFRNFQFFPSNSSFAGLRGYERGHFKNTAFAAAKGGESINEPVRTQWQIRCAFNSFCKQVLRREAMNAHRDIRRQQQCKISFSDLTPQEENELFTVDQYFADDIAEQYFIVGRKEINAKLLDDALHSLSKEKLEAVLLYYFFDMSEREIAKLRNISRTTVQYRRISSIEQLKHYLEERVDDKED